MIATDAWHPQVNGVVRTLDNVSSSLEKTGHQVRVFSAEGMKTRALPSYPEIRLAFPSQKAVAGIIREFDPDYIHVATEGPIGLAVRKYCVKNNLNFTTGFHTRFAEYVEVRVPLPGVRAVAYKWLRWFHGPGQAVFSPAGSVSRELKNRGFENVFTWTRGVDHELFRDYGQAASEKPARPIMIYTGRIAVEKGIEDFLKLDVAGTKRVIGDGPQRKSLERKYPDAEFLGYLFGEELAKEISKGDVFVFPSKTDTFGLVMLEAMACGLPVAAYPVTGPVDVVEHGVSGWLDNDLAVAVHKAAKLKRRDAVAHAGKFTWQNTARLFAENLSKL